MKKFIVAITVVAATASLAIAGTYEGGRGQHGRHRFAANLNLTDAQKQQMAAIKKADREKNQALYQSFAQKRAEYRQLKDANDPKADSVKAELQSMRAQVKAAHEATRQQFRGVLTADQLQKLDAARSAQRARGEQRKQMMAKLNLTDAQRQQLRQFREQDRTKNRQLFADFRAKRAELKQLEQANDPKADSVKAELQSMHEQLKAAHEARREQFRSVLTPEQQQMLDQMKSERGR